MTGTPTQTIIKKKEAINPTIPLKATISDVVVKLPVAPAINSALNCAET